MRIDSYGPLSIPKNPLNPPTEAGGAMSAHEKLRRLIEEKQSMVQSAFEAENSVPELGKIIDLRV